MTRRIVIVAVIAAVAAAAWLSPPAQRLRRSLAARKLYSHAVSRYMIQDVTGAAGSFRTIAQQYGDLPIGAMAEIKLAFLAYDVDDDEGPDSHEARRRRLDRAEALFRRYLDEHPQSVMYLSSSPLPDYEGELGLVAWYFLGRIAGDRGNTEEQRAWYEKIIDAGSRNKGNMIVSKVTVLLRQMDEANAKQGEKAG